MALFENYERRVDKINSVLAQYGISSIEECKEITLAKGIDCDKIVRGTQPICFENAIWAYTVGCAIAIKSGAVKAADAAAAIGIGLQSFCIPGSVAENRKVGLGHGNLGKMLLSEETECFCFLAGHESFAAAEGAIKIALNANKVRTKPLRVILNGQCHCRLCYDGTCKFFRGESFRKDSCRDGACDQSRRSSAPDRVRCILLDQRESRNPNEAERPDSG